MKQNSLFVRYCGVLFLAGFLAFSGVIAGEDENNNVNKSPVEQAGEENSGTQRSDRSLSSFVPGDAISISTYPDTLSFLHKVFPIDDRGYVDLPIYGKAKISNLNSEQVIQFLKDTFKDYLLYPNIQVKPLIRVSVLGGVPAPGFYYFDPDNSLWELLYLCQGATDEDGLRNMRWERDRKTVQRDLIPLLQSGISLKRMGFRTGDQIWVKTPGKPGFFEKLPRYLGLVTAMGTLVTLYYTLDIRSR